MEKDYLHTIFEYRDGNLYWKIKGSDRTIVGDKAGCVRKIGYHYTGLNKKQYRTHRLIFLYHHGYMPASIDHIDGDKLNNRIENLRECTDSQNQSNKPANSRSKSGIKGVIQVNNRWKAVISKDGVDKHLGYFETKEAAAEAYNRAAIERFGNYAKLNEVPNGTD